jgi:hypothetical protein
MCVAAALENAIGIEAKSRSVQVRARPDLQRIARAAGIAQIITYKTHTILSENPLVQGISLSLQPFLHSQW